MQSTMLDGVFVLTACCSAVVFGCGQIVEEHVSLTEQAEPNDSRTLIVDLGEGVAMEFVRVDLTEAKATRHGAHVKLFYIGRTEVTNAQFRRFLPTHDSNRRDRKHIIEYQAFIKSLNPEFNEEQQPAVYVQWEEADAFAAWLGKRAGLKFRLPTEMEWQRACQAGATTRFSWGDSLANACTFANTNDPETAKLFKFGEAFPCDDGYRVTAPVGSFKPNALGIYDMHGNAAEWTDDMWPQASSDPWEEIPVEKDTGKRVVKGGDFTCGPNGEAYFACECGARSWNYLGNANFGTGFRVVIEIEPD